MDEPQDTWPLPLYNPGAVKQLHALGVIANNYCEFEDRLIALAFHHLDIRKIERKTSEAFFFELTESKRLDFTKMIFALNEKDSDVLHCIERLVKYFEWAKETRNNLVHARQHRPLISEEHTVQLVKRTRKNSDLRYLQFKLHELRAIADQMHHGVTWCATISVYLRLRDNPTDALQWAFADTHVALPKIPDAPKSPNLTDAPPPPDIPQYLRKPSGP